MLNVLIIDDDLKDSKDLEMLCIHYFNKRNIDHKISIELKLNENLDIFSNVDILFLDVEIGNNNGIEFSKRLRKVYPELMIIITSKYSEYIKLDRDKSTFKSHRDFSSEKEITFKHL